MTRRSSLVTRSDIAQCPQGRLPEAATRKHTVSMPQAYEKISLRAGGSTSPSTSSGQASIVGGQRVQGNLNFEN